VRGDSRAQLDLFARLKVDAIRLARPDDRRGVEELAAQFRRDPAVLPAQVA
jgi:hypothetical protein